MTQSSRLPSPAEEVRSDRRSFHNTLLLALGAAVLAGMTLLPRLARPQSPLVGKPAPDFVLEVIHNGEPGDRLRLSDLKGKAVILSFWASWCGPCRMEAPSLDRLSRRLHDRGVAVVGVNTNDQRRSASAFAKQRNLSYPIVADDNGTVGTSYGVENLPTIVIVDKNGVVTAVRTGLTDEGALETLATAGL